MRGTGALRLRATALLATVVAAVALTAALMAPIVSGHGGVASLSDAAPASTTAHPGYWMAASDGGVYQFGTTNYGGMRRQPLNKPIVGATATASGRGYWLVASDGGIFTFGDARFHGSTGNLQLVRPIVGMAADKVTGGYWLVASDGGVFTFDAHFYGSIGGKPLVEPVVGMAPTPDGGGYWLVAADGGIFTFGDAHFYGSIGGKPLDKPVVGMAATPDGGGYWLVASDGGIFTFGDAHFYGSMGGKPLAKPVVGMAATPSGGGYWMAAADGGIFTFGNAPMLGSAASAGSPAPIVAMMSTANGYPFPPGGTGYDVSQYQCPQYQYAISGLPSTHTAVAVVQVSGGAIDQAQPAACYPEEAQWAGPNLSDYIFLDPLPSLGAPKSMSGPAGNCGSTDANCQSYNYGYNWAQYWVSYAHADNTNPTLWWLDVEKSGFSTSSSAQYSNSRLISGAFHGLEDSGVQAGIYSTNLQWGEITNNYVSFPGAPLWVSGAGNISGGTYSANNMCSLSAQPVNYSNPISEYAPFAGGKTVLVQYGYQGNGYTGPSSQYDQDYACP